MRNSTISLGSLFLLLAVASHASDELLAVAMEEQEAFREGDCDKVVSLMAEDITFYANSRRMNREQVGNFCQSVKRPFGAGRSPIEDTVTPYLISENLGYTVRDFRFQEESERVVHEVVTKIWLKGESGWKMIHFQATILPEQRTKQQN